ncbi:WD40-repeat-containing domain protein, partial [Globomyces pollinis-pini]
SPVIIKEFAAVTTTAFSQAPPHEFAIASSTRVQLYSTVSQSVSKTISRFKETVYSADVRNDGKLLVAGDASGLLQLFDLSSRAILRSLQAHNGAIRVSKFGTNHNTVVSASDDNTVKLWDITSEDPLNEFNLHTDYVRSASNSIDTPSLILSGSYDHTVRLWDTRSNACTLTMDHDAPVESVLFLPGGGLVASSGGNKIKIWDMFSGGRLVQSISHHQKTITCMTLDGTKSYLLSGSLDHQVKVLSLQDYKVVHTIKHSAPILSLGISPTNSHIAVGMANGYLSIRKRTIKTTELAAPKPKVRGGTHAHFTRTGDGPDEDAVVVQSDRLPRLAVYDKLLKEFRYSDALDAAIESSNPIVVISMCEELMHRDGIRIALGNRNEEELIPIMTFIQKQIAHPNHTPILTDVLNIILDIYSKVVTHSQIMDEHIYKILEKIRNEIKVQYSVNSIIGMLDSLSHTAEMKSVDA